jgi:hypothetical protein
MPEGLSSEDEFHVILRRECARSDRNGHGFSVVAFNVGGESTRSALAERLTSVVFQRLRATDEMGWLDDERIGVLLYNTPREKAWHNMRLEVTPGIACLWQIYARHSKSFDRWARLDIEYIRKRSPLFDLKLLLLTIPAVISMKGAS